MEFWQGLILQAEDLTFDEMAHALSQEILTLKEQEGPLTYREAYLEAQNSWHELCKPLNSLGELERQMSQLIALARLREDPAYRREAGLDAGLLERVSTVVFFADNGVVASGVSQAGAEVTSQVYRNIQGCKSSVAIVAERENSLLLAVNLGCRDLEREAIKPATFCAELCAQCEELPSDFKTIELTIHPEGTKNFHDEAAMTKRELIMALAAGFKIATILAEHGFQLLVGGEMGIGNTSSSTALACARLGLDPYDFTGRGAGLSDAALGVKKRLIQEAIERTCPKHPLAALRELGGFDIAALVGFYLGASSKNLPVLLDGLISLVAAYIASEVIPESQTVMLATHMPRELTAQRLLDELGLKAPYDLDLALGEGCAALFALPVLRHTEAIWRQLPSFQEGKVNQYINYQKGPRRDYGIAELPEELFRAGDLTVIYGGEKAGKSEFAETAAFVLASSTEDPLLYIATLYIGEDPENQERVKRHQAQRAGYGFANREIYFNFKEEVERLPRGHIILLDCLTNLLTNRLYQPVADSWQVTADSDELILEELVEALMQIARQSSHLFIVANDLHRNLSPSDPELKRFLRLHGKLLQRLARAENANLYELVFGRPRLVKRRERSPNQESV